MPNRASAEIARLAILLLLLVPLWTACAHAADMTARQVAVAVYKTPAGAKIDLSAKDLSELDLAGIDFKAALLGKTNFYGSDLTRANLTGSDLAGAKLDRAIITRANFASANLEGVTILKPSVFTTPDFDLAESPSFEGANLKGARISAALDGVNFRRAALAGAKIGPFDMSVEAGIAPSSLMKSADFTGADLSGVEMRNVNFTFSRFTNARLNGALLVSLDLTNADFAGADLTGVEFSACNMQGANFKGAKGLDSVKGLETVFNLNRSDW